MPTIDETALNADLSRTFQNMYALNRAIADARNRGDVADVQNMLSVYKTLLAHYKEVSAKLGQKDFSALDKFVLDTGTYVQKAAAAIPDAVGALPSAIGKGLLKGALPFVALVGIYLFLKGKL